MKRHILAAVLLFALGVTALSDGLQRPLNQERYDSFSDSSDRTLSNPTWGHYIKTQDEMIQPISIRIDDVGVRDSTASYAKEAIVTYGLRVSLPINAFYLTGGSADSTMISNLLVACENAGKTNYIEWVQHGNSSMLPTLNGYSAGTNGDWTDYFDWTWANWVVELRKDEIVDRVNGISAAAGLNYRIQKSDIRGIVWPGDTTPAVDRDFVRTHVEFFNALMDTLDYDWAVTGSNDAGTFKFAVQTTANAAPQSGLDLSPFCFSQSFYLRSFLPWPSTFDLTNNNVVERGATAKVPWAPATTTEWTLAQNTNYFNGTHPDSTDYTDYTTSNSLYTFRWKYSKALSSGGGFSLVLHDEEATNGETFTWPYPDGAVNASLTSVSSVNGGAGTVGNVVDFSYMFAALSEIIDAGFAQTMTVGEHMKWLASKPGKPGLIINGWEDPTQVYRAIGDTVGLDIPLLLGGGQVGIANEAHQADTILRKGFQQGDADFDGKDDWYGEGTAGWSGGAPDAKFYIADGYGPAGQSSRRSAMFLHDDSGLSARVSVGYSMLPPGNYLFTATFQSAERFYSPNGGYVYSVGRSFVRNDKTAGTAGYGAPTDTVLTFLEAKPGAVSATSQYLFVHNSGTQTGATDFGDDNWPGGTPTVRTQSGWYTLRVPFTVPSRPAESTAYDPTNTGAAAGKDARGTAWAGTFAYDLAFVSEDRSGDDNLEEHTRFGPARLIWLGPE